MAVQVKTAEVAFPAAAAKPLGVDGAVLSTTIALFAPREFVAPGVGNVNVAATPNAVLLMVPLFSASAEVLAKAHRRNGTTGTVEGLERYGFLLKRK